MLMRLYAGGGQRAQALRQYQLCRDALWRDLRATPDGETERLYREVQDESQPARAMKADAAKLDFAAPIESKPSIAVLPFTNMSGDPEQDYFSDGITEDIITELSRFRSLFVIARISSFQYKGRNVDARRVAQELGVQYVLEGSVRKTGDRIRISAQLIDCVTGNHLWSERFDRALIDIFAVQDEVLQGGVARAEGRLVASVAEQARRKPTEHLAAYDLLT